jgi:hypothetical protein
MFWNSQGYRGKGTWTGAQVKLMGDVYNECNALAVKRAVVMDAIQWWPSELNRTLPEINKGYAFR